MSFWRRALAPNIGIAIALVLVYFKGTSWRFLIAAAVFWFLVINLALVYQQRKSRDPQ
jgi:hypothetical protein